MEIKPAKKPLKIFIHAMDGTGHLNACVGVAEALVKRGHSVLFLVNAAFKGQFAKFGFEELSMERPKKEDAEKDTKKAPEDHVNPVKAFAKMILNMGLLNEKTPLERMKELSENRAKGNDKDEQFAKSLYESTVDFNPQIKRAIEERKPDLFILDHFLVPPCLPESGMPWLYLFSGNPIAIYSSITKDLPPFATGYPTDGDRAEWEEYLVYQRENAASFSKYQQRLYETFGYEPNPAEDLPVDDGGIFPQCKYGYVYGYPKELDYQDLITIPEKFIGMDAFCRETKPAEPFKLPEGFAKEGDKLIFFSLGSMGSVDVDLVKRVVSILSSKTPYKTIVSKGPLADEYELPKNCWGEGFLPQTQILPIVDLVITHGGNNTVTETFSFGKPMIIMPLFGDQFDNAQRVHEKGFGRRLETYKFKDEELVDAVETLINDQQLKERLQTAAKRIVADRSKEVACMKIEAVVEKYAK